MTHFFALSITAVDTYTRPSSRDNGIDKPSRTSRKRYWGSVRHQSFLQYARLRYFKLALLISLLSAVAYVVYRPPQGSYGGSWVGYTLGTIGALLILMLLWFGVRKRRYRSNVGQVQGWLSAHVYLGTSLIVIVTLHAGFEVGWNVHTLAYVLMLLVIASGMIGAYAYTRWSAICGGER